MKLHAAVACGVVGLVAIIDAGAQSPRVAQPADYGQFESLAPPQAGGLSPDGRWIAYGINRSNRNNELRIARLRSVDSARASAGQARERSVDSTRASEGQAEDTHTVAIPFGAQAAFSADSRWAAYRIGMSEAQEDKLKADKKPIHNKAGVLDLERSEKTIVDDIESFGFNASGSHLAMRRYAPEPEKKGNETPAPESEGPSGATLVVRQLSTGRDTTFGNVAEYAWQDKGRLLAIAISTEDKTGNGIQLFDPETGALRTLDSSAATYSGLAWRKDANGLATLRSKKDDRHDGPTHIALAWTHLGEAGEARHSYDPMSDATFSGALRTVSYRKPTWSDDGRVVFLGVGRWLNATPTPSKTTTTAEGEHADDPPKPQQEREEPAGVDVWHWRDVDVMPKQKLSAKADRERSMLAAWHVESGRFVQLAKELTEQVTPVKHQAFAYAATWSAYAMDRSIGRPSADLSLVDLASGERTKIRERVNDHEAQISPAGRYVLIFQDDHYWTINTSTRAAVNITKTVQTSFVNRESDETVKQKPPFGVAGWTTNDESVILYDKFDLWQIAPDGSRTIPWIDVVVSWAKLRTGIAASSAASSAANSTQARTNF
jgi:hypothetical protein